MTPLNQLLDQKQEKLYAQNIFNQHLDHIESGKRCFLVMEGVHTGLDIPPEKARYLVENALEHVSEDLYAIEAKLDAINTLLSDDIH